MKTQGKSKNFQKSQMKVLPWTDEEFTHHSYPRIDHDRMDIMDENDDKIAMINRYGNKPFFATEYTYEFRDTEFKLISTSKDVNEIMSVKAKFLEHHEIELELKSMRKKRIPHLRIVR